ncbi:hypothetical protein DPEC_G00069290 [Dallia pectoralis]|uniref:Uncharacterized protein n=1 Tax=Dallia pectoralis TaxID=75939 RepID=A0ACC2H1X9_DALPE|nr:hypothetical protein DPEC_G00069290 [Dallia pectoralis]
MKYSQTLKSYKYNIAERHSCFDSYVHKVLSNDTDRDALLRSISPETAKVNKMHALIDHCLKSEERAHTFLKIFTKLDPDLYTELKRHGPRGKFVRKEAPAVDLTALVRSALGAKVCDLYTITGRVENQWILIIWPALEVLVTTGQLLPEEYSEFELNKHNHPAMVKQLERICDDTEIPEPNRRFISLVVNSFNMHMFHLAGISMQDVFVFV